MIENAQRLARAGFWIFPIKEGQKQPPLIHGFQINATRDPAQIARWWKRWPGANIGISTSRFGTDEALIVIDVDNKDGRDGFTSLEMLDVLHGHELPGGLTVRTPTGGCHYYFRTPVAVKQGVNILGDGLDVRSRGGYVLAPGSRVAAGEYAYDGLNADVPAAPQWVIDRCGFDTPHVDTPPREGVNPILARERAVEYLDGLEVAAAGGRNDAGFRVAARLRDFGIEHVDAADIMREHWKCEPPLENAELDHVVDSAYRYARGEAGGDAPEAYFEIIPDGSAETGGAVLESAGQVGNGLALLRDEPGTKPPALRLVKGMLREGGLSLWVADPDAGKTTVLQHLGLSVAHGLPFIGRHTVRGAVLLCAFERADDVQGRLDSFYAEHPDLSRDADFYYVNVESRALATQGTANLIVNAIRSSGLEFKLVIIDTLAAALHGDENDSQAIGDFMRAAKFIKNKTNSHVAVAHHYGKERQRGARGHSKLLGDFDSVFSLADGTIVPEKLKAKKDWVAYYAIAPVVIGKDEDGDPITSVVMQNAAGPSTQMTADDNKVVHLLEKCAREPAPAELLQQGVAEVVDRKQWITAVAVMAPGTTKDPRRWASTKIQRLLRRGLNGIEFNKEFIWSVDSDGVFPELDSS